MVNLKIGCVVLLMVVSALFGEKLMHKEETSVENLTVYLLHDIFGFGKGIVRFFLNLFKSPKSYHYFEESFIIHLKETVEDYLAKGFEVKCSLGIDKNIKNPARYISISFITKQNYSNTELEELTTLELEQFRQYLEARGLLWKTFATFNQYKRKVHILLYFAEFQDEEAFLLHRYEILVKEATQGNCTLITDDELDKELDNVS